jgi:DNA-binding transcriptional LysR family regulator
MQQVRIAISATPEELHRLVRQGSADAPDLTIVAVVDGEVALLLEAARADVVVVGAHDGPPSVVQRLLDEYPGVGVVCVDLAGGHGAVYQLRPQLTAIDDVSPGAIVAAIRSAAEDTVAWGNR